jgi:hypothetical protein
MESAGLARKHTTVTGDEHCHVAESLPKGKQRLPETRLPELNEVTLT